MGQADCASRLCLLPAPWEQGCMNIWIFCLSDDQQQEIALGWTELFGDLCFVSFTHFFSQPVVQSQDENLWFIFQFFHLFFPLSLLPHPTPFFFFSEIMAWYFTNHFSILQTAFLTNWLSKNIAQFYPVGIIRPQASQKGCCFTLTAWRTQKMTPFSKCWEAAGF